MPDSNRISIVFASDEVMAMPLAVSIGSLLLSKNKADFLDIHVLSCGISRKSKSHAERAILEFGKDAAQVTWHDIIGEDAILLQRLYTDSNRPYPPANYARLLVGKHLPAGLERVIYMDIDTLTLRDLSPLWKIPFDGTHILAVVDLPQRNGQVDRLINTISLKDQDRHDFRSDRIYFQAGMMVLDLAAFRSRLVDDLLEILASYPQLTFPDQDALNIVFARYCKLVDPRWNSAVAIYWYADHSQSPFDADMFHALQHDPFIVHYSGRPKPWEDGCNHPLADRWHQVYAAMPWIARRTTILTRFLDRVPRVRRVLGKKVRRGLGL